jgi:hypothetical protein
MKLASLCLLFLYTSIDKIASFIAIHPSLPDIGVTVAGIPAKILSTVAISSNPDILISYPLNNAYTPLFSDTNPCIEATLNELETVVPLFDIGLPPE